MARVTPGCVVPFAMRLQAPGLARRDVSARSGTAAQTERPWISCRRPAPGRRSAAMERHRAERYGDERKESPARPGLAQGAAGPRSGTGHRSQRRRSQRHRHLQSGGQPVRIRGAVDSDLHVPDDARRAGGVRPDRTAHRCRPGHLTAPQVSDLAGRRVHRRALCRQHRQRRRGSRRGGRSRRAAQRRSPQPGMADPADRRLSSSCCSTSSRTR